MSDLKKSMLFQQLTELERSLGDGLHGIVSHPNGQEGYVSITGDGSSISWFIIGEGQNPIEVLKVARMLHGAYATTELADPSFLREWGAEARRLAQPKNS